MTTQVQVEQMNIVVVGHVDHGKSTMVGRLLADTQSLPDGKLAAVKAFCAQNSRPFEYAFLLDALKDEQSQGITIDTARCFFKTDKRHYIIIDAPGHIEFLKNMISGAARAEAAVLLIDAHEGVMENSRRHGYMLSMLGIKQVVVCVNKMDLVDYSQETFERVEAEYREFLKKINVEPRCFIPISAREGDCIASLSEKMPWYDGAPVLDAIDDFQKETALEQQALRMPVQDIYKFTDKGDDRRLVVGRIESGSLEVGDEVLFLPSEKRSKISSIEAFSAPVAEKAICGQSTALTLETQIYIRPGELMCKVSEAQPAASSRLKVNIFWMGRQPMVKNKQYKLKLGTAHVPVFLEEIHHVLDASELSSDQSKSHIDRHDVAECTLQSFKPIAFDLTSEIASTGRFVIVDNYEIAGGGIVMEALGNENKLLQDYIEQREQSWERSQITPQKRQGRFGHAATLVILTGPMGVGKQNVAKALEERLFAEGRYTYYLGVSNSLLGVQKNNEHEGRAAYLQRLGELSHLFTDAGLILITAISDADDYELDLVRKLNQPGELLHVNIGENRFSRSKADLQLEPGSDDLDEIVKMLQKNNVLGDYMI